MSFNTGEAAIAVWDGSGWALKPVCGELAVGDAALGVMSSGWALSRVPPLGDDDKALAVHAGSGWALVPLECGENDSDSDGSGDSSGDSGSGCSGNDPLCTLCECSAYLQETYTVSLSGFPDVCGAAGLNGTWTVTWVSDCTWVYDIDAYRRVTLSMTGESQWTVAWRVEGGPSGYHLGSGSGVCTPEEYAYSLAYCYAAFTCFNFCNLVMSNVSVVVA